MPDRGRIIAISYSPSGRTGSWQPWAAMGAAKAAMEALVRYFAVALGLSRDLLRDQLYTSEADISSNVIDVVICTREVWRTWGRFGDSATRLQ